MFQDDPLDGTIAAPSTEVSPFDAAPVPEAPASSPVSAARPLTEQLTGRELDVIAPSRGPAVDGPAGAEQLPAELVAGDEEPPDPCAAAGLLVCEGFESAELGRFPAGAGWLPELAGCGTHVVDGEGPALTGVQALRAGAGGYPECMLHAELGAEQEVFVRTHVLLGAGGDLLDHYVSLLELGVRAAQDDPELRIGVRPPGDSLCPGAPGLDVSGSALVGGPATECTGFSLETERWYCIEARFSRNGSRLSVNLAVDGVELVEREFTGGPAWLGRGSFVKLGRAAYGSSGGGALWHDDVAVSREPLPCPDPAG